MPRTLSMTWPALSAVPLIATAAFVGADGPTWPTVILAGSGAALWFWTAVRVVREALNEWDASIAKNVEASGRHLDAMIQSEGTRRGIRYRPTDGSDMLTSARNMTGPEE